MQQWLSLTCRVEGVGRKLCMDSFFSSSDLFDDRRTKGVNCCGTVRTKSFKECQGALTIRY